MNKLLPLLVLVAACGQANDPVAVSANEPILSGIVWGNRVHILPYNAGATPAAAPAGAHLTYYGGRVVSNMQVVQVLWGGTGAGAGSGQYLGNVWNTTSPSIATFYQGVLNSGYVDWLTEYNTPATGGTNQVIGRGSFLAQYRITPSTTATSVSDATIQSEIVAQINAGHLPAPTTDAAGNTNTYYAVFFPHGTTITQGGSSSCVAGGFCAYHGTIAATTSQKEVFYGVHPDMQTGSGCDTGCGGSTAFNNYTSVASHEAIETVTDAEVGIGTTISAPLAWYDSTNGEIGDICNAQQGTIVGSDGVTYTVQAEFSNTANNCVITRTATNDFSISASPTSLTVAAGASGTSTISTAVSSGTAGTVTLTVSGAPSGVTASLSPSSVTAGGSSTLTVTAASTAASATATITITGTEGTVTHSTTVSLTVNGTTPPPTTGITNGGFESGTTGWTTTGTAGVSTTAHSGVDSLQLGSASPTNGDSTAAQTFTAPSTGGTLSFWYKMTCPDSVTYDWATATLKDNTAGTTTTVLAKTCATNASWVQVSTTLTASHSYTVTLVSHDDNYAGDPSYTLYDDVAIGSSAPPPPPPAGGITNGNFEAGSLTGWTSTGTTAVSTAQKHGGTYSARLGSTSPTNGDSTISQTFTAPTGTTSVALYYYMVCPDTVTYDWATVSLKDNTAGTTATLLAKTCTNSAAWTQVTGGVTAGHSYTVTLTSHDDNYASDPTYTYYDDVTVQ